MPQGDYDGLFSAANQGKQQINLGIFSWHCAQPFTKQNSTSPMAIATTMPVTL
jgi:hypothetical protein